jgi:glyoxylate reductase
MKCSATFAKMKRTAVFVNTSRGPVVDQDALADALQQGYLRPSI